MPSGSAPIATKRTTRGEVRPISVAPMLDRTDRHFRWLMRQISRQALLYTEMVTTHAILHGDRERLLGYDPLEHPVALQLGGDDPRDLAACARIAEDIGYDEVNLNVGCPSDRVQSGNFGVCLMREPDRVAEGVAAMRAAVRVPVTVKHRIGVDDDDSYGFMERFALAVSDAGADRLTVHARKAWLHGLSPKENRTIPPLRYDEVHRLKREHPDWVVEINGGFTSLDACAAQLGHVDAVMVGRAAYDDPWHFHDVDARFFGVEPPTATRREVVERLAAYVDAACVDGTRPLHVIKHALGLFAGVPGARAWKRVLTEGCKHGGGDGDLVIAALQAVEAQQARTAA